jgi:leucyl aminopeptidase
VPIAFSATTEVPPEVDHLGVPVFEGLEVAALAPVELDRKYCAERDFAARPGEAVAVPPGGGATVVAVGLGERGKASAETFRRAGAALARAAQRAPAAALWLRGAIPDGVEAAAVAQAVVEGAALAGYQFTPYKADRYPAALGELTLVGSPGEVAHLDRGARRGAVVARAVGVARDLVNEPAGAMTPRRLAQLAADLGGKAGLEVTVMDEADIKDAGLGGLAGVGRGSDEPPRLVRLAYEPAPEVVAGAWGAGRRAPTVALVGKGITFDSGGLSLKTAEGMMAMKTDMSGAAAVLATMSVLRELEVPARVLGLMPVAENMPGGRAIKPGDVLKIRNGKTIEVLNTDAEGRLILADALSLAVEADPDAVVDLATLTGACVVALGRQVAGLMGNHDGFVGQVRAAADRAGELVWPLPLPEQYRRQIESDVADMKNIGTPGQAGALVAGLILSEFVGEVPWAHLDIAGPARSDADEGYVRRGATGFGVRTLLELVSSFEPPAAPGTGSGSRRTSQRPVTTDGPGGGPRPRPTPRGQPKGAAPSAGAGARSSRGPRPGRRG